MGFSDRVMKVLGGRNAQEVLANIDITAQSLDLGKSGLAGELDIFPSTASKGRMRLTCTDQTGDTIAELKMAAFAAARVITIPDPGGAADLVLTESAQTINGNKTFGGEVRTSKNVGAVAGTGNTVVEQGIGIIHQSVITLTAHTIALTDAAGVVAHLGSKIYDFPAGAILILGATLNIVTTKSSAGVNADWDSDVALGTVVASNNSTLSSTEQNIIPTTATPQASSSTSTFVGQSTASENAVLDGTSTAVDCYLNVLVDDADHDVTGTACNFIFNGTVTLSWVNLGDY